jgi:hypothetical protein
MRRGLYITSWGGASSGQQYSVRTKTGKKTKVAVGTLVAQRPPLRSVRAALPHTALALGNDAKTH